MQANHRFPIAHAVNKVLAARDGNKNDAIDLPGATIQAVGGKKKAPKPVDEVSLSMGDRVLLRLAKSIGYDATGIDPLAIAAAADADGDGRVTREELTRVVRGIDRNQDDHVDRLEISAALAALRKGEAPRTAP